MDYEIEKLLREGRSIAEVCAELQVSDFTVRDIAIRKFNRWRVSNDGMGRPELRKYIVCIKHVDASWPEKNEKLARAKRDYDDGKVEMCQGRDRNNIIQYAIPRHHQRRLVSHRYFGWDPRELMSA